MPGRYKLEIEEMKLRTPESMIPQLNLNAKLGTYEDDAGIYHLNHEQTLVVHMTLVL